MMAVWTCAGNDEGSFSCCCGSSVVDFNLEDDNALGVCGVAVEKAVAANEAERTCKAINACTSNGRLLRSIIISF